MPLASDIMDHAAALLNDASQDKFTDAIQLPFLRMALEDLETAYANNGVPLLHKTYEETIPAEDTEFATQPADLIIPIRLYEKLPGETDDKYLDMDEKNWPPNEVPLDTLRFWIWNDDTVQFLGATVDRTVRMEYYRSFAAVASGATNINAIKSKNFLAKRTAAYCAAFIGGNESRAGALSAEAAHDLRQLLVTAVHSKQNRPQRSKAYY